MNEADVLRLIASLLFIVALILVGAWATRRAGWLRTVSGQAIKVAGTQSLGARAYVSIIEVEDARLVVGVTGNQITLLHTMPPAAPGAGASRAAASDPAQPPSFASSLARVLTRRRG